MHVRLSRYKMKPGKEEEFITKSNALGKDMAKTGAVAAYAANLGDDDYVTIAFYESEEAAEAAREPARRVWGQLSDVVDLDSMHVEAGNLTWLYSRSER